MTQYILYHDTVYIILLHSIYIIVTVWQELSSLG